MQEDIQKKILKCVDNEYKSITQIAKELNENRNRVNVHVKKLFQRKELLRRELDKSKHKKGFKYKVKRVILN